MLLTFGNYFMQETFEYLFASLKRSCDGPVRSYGLAAEIYGIILAFHGRFGG